MQRFVGNEFSEEHRKTKKKAEHFPTLILNESLFELKLIDLPVIPFFPTDSLSEWTDYRFYGLRSAAAYLLVYDASVPSSFHFVKAIRDQMYESRDMTHVPVIVVANKMDMVATTINQQRQPHHSQPHPPVPLQLQARLNSFNSSNHLENNGLHHDKAMLHQQSTTTTAAVLAGSAAADNTAAAASASNAVQCPASEAYYDRKEISQLVRKTWRSAHVECSAKYNWNIVTVFRELAITLDMVANGQVIGGSHSSVRKRRCLVF